MGRSLLLAVVTVPIVVSALVVSADEPGLAKAPFNAERARELQEEWAKRIDKPLIHTNSIGMQLALLPPGEFTMGRTEEEYDKLLKIMQNDPEMRKNIGGMVTWSMLMMPAHRVRLTKPFYMGTTEVTVGQFRRFADATVYKTEAEQGLNHGQPYSGGRAMSTWRKPMAWRKDYRQQDNEPVMHLCWNDCVAFCEWLSKQEGRQYCLPTEAEWEYACRAGTTTPWSFGDYADFDLKGEKHAIWSDGGQKFEVPQAVAQRQPNAFGLYDMHGNMWEYVADWWHRLSYKESPLNDPTGPAVQSEKGDMRRIIRGSSFDWGRWGGDSAYRMRITQRSNQHPHMSFRVAMRMNDVQGVVPATDPDEQRRQLARDPGPDSDEVIAALTADVANEECPKELTVQLGRDVKMEFVLIPSGSFLMGSATGPKDERPIHRVVISNPFYMAKHEVTQSQWEAVMGADRRLAELRQSDADMAGPNKAMNALSWTACQRFIERLKAKSPDLALALPTEAQWEYACRAGTASEFHFGDDEDGDMDQYAWFEGNMIWPGKPNFKGRTYYHDVAVKKPNAWGLYDMHGGVWEWCEDRYDEDYYFDSPLANPQGPESGRFRVIRGGSWFRYPKYARSAYRRFFDPDADSDGVTAWVLDFGCRLVINSGGDKGPSPARVSASKAKLLRLAENLERHPANPVLDVGESGAWDEGRCGCFSVEQVGGRLHLYYMGSGGHTAWQIGLATSKDGITWQRSAANPVLRPGAQGTWDDKQVSMPYVLNDNGRLMLWYAGSGRGGGFGLATSSDGVRWQRSGSEPVMRGIGGSMDPCIRKLDGRYVMWYCGKRGESYRIFQATSPDGISWERAPEPVLPLGKPGDFDETSHAGPVVLKVEDQYFLFHLGGSSNGWQIGLATSSDGVQWMKSQGSPILAAGDSNAWDDGSILSLDVLFLDGRFHVWYAANRLADGGKPENEQTIRIGYASSAHR